MKYMKGILNFHIITLKDWSKFIYMKLLKFFIWKKHNFSRSFSYNPEVERKVLWNSQDSIPLYYLNIIWNLFWFNQSSGNVWSLRNVGELNSSGGGSILVMRVKGVKISAPSTKILFKSFWKFSKNMVRSENFGLLWGSTPHPSPHAHLSWHCSHGILATGMNQNKKSKGNQSYQPKRNFSSCQPPSWSWTLRSQSAW